MLEAGIQLHLPSYNHLSLADLVRMGQLAHSGGIGQLWVTDNLQSRNAFVVLAALAANVPARLGTAVLVHYFRSPVDVADAVGTIAEMMDGRELALGISRGNPGTPRLVQTPKPISTLRETAQSLRRLLDGETIYFRDYPTLREYFNLAPEHPYKLNFAPGSPVPLYCGGNAPLSLAVGGEHMDGVMWGWSFLAAARSGRIAELLKIADEAARRAGRPAPLPRVAEVKIYLSPDREAARAYCRHAVGSRMLGLRATGYTDEHFARMGIPAVDVERLHQASAGGASRDALAEFVTDPIVDALFVAGDLSYCRERMAEVCTLAREHGFQQVMFSEMGPDPAEATRLLCEHVLPVL